MSDLFQDATDAVTDAAWTQSGKRLAFTSLDGRFWVWDLFED